MDANIISLGESSPPLEVYLKVKGYNSGIKELAMNKRYFILRIFRKYDIQVVK